MSDALWAFVVWLGTEPSRIAGLFITMIVIGVFGGYWSRRRRK